MKLITNINADVDDDCYNHMIMLTFSINYIYIYIQDIVIYGVEENNPVGDFVFY
jgi:hypothetical protein